MSFIISMGSQMMGYPKGENSDQGMSRNSVAGWPTSTKAITLYITSTKVIYLFIIPAAISYIIPVDRYRYNCDSID